MTATTFPPFRVEASSRGRMFYSSAGSARQAFAIAREELESGAVTVTVASEQSFPDLLEALSLVGSRVPHLLVVDTRADESPYGYRLAFFPADLALVVALEGVAPFTPSVPLVGRVPREGLSC